MTIIQYTALTCKAVLITGLKYFANNITRNNVICRAIHVRIDSKCKLNKSYRGRKSDLLI